MKEISSKFFVSDQVFLVILFDVLTSKKTAFSMPEFSEKYQVLFQKWNYRKEHRTTLYNRVSATFNTLIERKKIVSKGRNRTSGDYMVIVEDESRRTEETIRLFQEYIEKLQDEIAVNEGENLILSDRLITEMLVYHGEDIYKDEEYYCDPAAM